MWKLRNIPRQYAAAAGGLMLVLAMSAVGVSLGAGARRDTAALSLQLEAFERSAAAQITAMQGRIDAMPPRAAKEYLVRTCDRKIGIYDGTGSVLYEILDIDIRTLPAADRAMLDAGILITGEAALRALTEDYTS